MAEFELKQTPDDYGWHRRGYLRHFDGPQCPQFVTFRLADSLPRTLLERWASEVSDDVELRKRIEVYLDAGYGECWLAREDIASLVQNALKYHNEARYELIAWVIMPNHVHALMAPKEGEHLPEILHSIKSFSAQKANEILGRSGRFWQRESFDRYIRNEKHYASVIRYIENNPVKAGLCSDLGEWRFSSAYKGSD